MAGVGNASGGIGRVVERVLPRGTRRRSLLTRAMNPTHAADLKVFRRYIGQEELASVAEPLSAKGGPYFSLIVPAFNTPERYLEPMVASVLAQTYAGWELVLVNACTNANRSQAIEGQASRDPRIHVISLGGNLGIAGNTNAGLDVAEGDFIGFLDHDDCLAPFALNEVAAAIAADPARDLFYSDEDLLSEDGARRLDPFLKPAWSPEMFLCANYLAHFSVASAQLVAAVGGIRSEYDGAQDYDFLLRAVSGARAIHHIPHISYHWRMAVGSAATGSRAKPHAQDASYRAVRDHLLRLGVDASLVRIPSSPSNFRVMYGISDTYTVHVAGVGLLEGADASSWADAGLLVRPLPERWSLTDLPAEDLLLIVEAPGGVSGGEWLRELVGVALQPEVGVVGPALCDRDGSRLGACYVSDRGHLRPLRAGEPLDRWTRINCVDWPRNLVSIGGIGLLRVAVGRRLAASGCSLRLAELSVAAYGAGLRNVLWPFSAFHVTGPLPRTDVVPPGQDPFLNPMAIALAAAVDA